MHAAPRLPYLRWPPPQRVNDRLNSEGAKVAKFLGI